MQFSLRESDSAPFLRSYVACYSGKFPAPLIFSKVLGGGESSAVHLKGVAVSWYSRLVDTPEPRLIAL